MNTILSPFLKVRSLGSSRVAVDESRCSARAPRAKSPIALHIERQPLKEAAEVAYPVAAAFEHLELVIQSFNEAAAVMLDEVIGDAVEPGEKRIRRCRLREADGCREAKRGRESKHQPMIDRSDRLL